MVFLRAFQIAAVDCDCHGFTFLIAVSLCFTVVMYLMCEDRLDVHVCAIPTCFGYLFAIVNTLRKSTQQDLKIVCEEMRHYNTTKITNKKLRQVEGPP